MSFAQEVDQEVSEVISNESIDQLDKENLPAIQYTNQLFDVTNQGVYDNSGNFVDPNKLPELEAPGPSAETFSLSPVKKGEGSEDFEKYKSELNQSWSSQANFAESQLTGVQQDIRGQQERFDELEAIIEQTQVDLEPIEEEISQLEDLLNVYNGEIDRLKVKIVTVENKIAEKTVALKQLILELDEINTEFELLKGVASAFIRLLHDQSSHLTDTEDQVQENVKLLLYDGTVSEALIETSYLETMEETGRQVFHRLENKRREANQKQQQVQQERIELDYLLEALNREKRSLEQIRANKTEILEETQNKQSEYEKLLEASREERRQLDEELSGMKDIETLIRQQLSALQRGLSQVQGASSQEDLLGLSRAPSVRLSPGASAGISGTFEVDPELLKKLEEDLKDGTKQNGLSWPLKSPNKITATFSDSSYVKTFGRNHNAADMRARHGSDVLAAADGMVIKTHFSGKSYASIVIVHTRSSLPPEYDGNGTGLMTLYGHVSQIDVRPGDIVRRGEVIGKSGATPGTDGAGLSTTGAHLHFEVRDGGKLVDPLEYLILAGVNDDHLPSTFKSYNRDRTYWREGL